MEGGREGAAAGEGGDGGSGGGGGGGDDPWRDEPDPAEAAGAAAAAGYVPPSTPSPLPPPAPAASTPSTPNNNGNSSNVDAGRIHRHDSDTSNASTVGLKSPNVLRSDAHAHADPNTNAHTLSHPPAGGDAHDVHHTESDQYVADDFDLCSVFSTFTGERGCELRDGDDDGPMHPPVVVGGDYIVAPTAAAAGTSASRNRSSGRIVPYGASYRPNRTAGDGVGGGGGDSGEDDHTHTTGAPSIFSHLTEMTDRTRMIAEYRASSHCTEHVESHGLSDPAGFLVVCAVVFVGEMSRGITFPTLWPFVQRLGGTEVTMGYCIAFYSFGRVVVSPLFGHVSVVGGYRFALLSAMIILTVGSVMYSQAESWGGGGPGVLLAAQTVMGVGSGTLGVTRAYVAEVTPRGMRTRYLAYLTSFIYAGFTVTPILGALLVWHFERLSGDDASDNNDYNINDDDANGNDGEEGAIIRAGPLSVNEYNAPGYILALSCLLTLAALYLKLEHRRRDPPPKITKFVSSRVKRSAALPEAVALGRKRVFFGRVALIDAAVWGCLLLNVVSKGCLSVYETVGVKLAEEMFDLDSKAVGVTVSACGMVGVVLLLCMRYIVQRLTDVQMIVGGMMLTVVGITGVIDYGKAEDGGEGQLGAGRFIVGMFFVFAVGYPISDTANVGLFSKLAGNKPQGTLQGLLACSSAFARMGVPVVASYVTRYLSMNALFAGLAVVLVCSAGTVLWFRKSIGILST